jgi:hypothetical protein
VVYILGARQETEIDGSRICAVDAYNVIGERRELAFAHPSQRRDVVAQRDAAAALSGVDARRGGHPAIVAAMPIRQRRLTFEARA